MAVLLTKEHGKPLTQARDEIDASCGFIRYAAESARRIEGEIVTSEIDQEQTWIQRVPYGVTVGIVAWNFPLAFSGKKIWKFSGMWKYHDYQTAVRNTTNSYATGRNH